MPVDYEERLVVDVRDLPSQEDVRDPYCYEELISAGLLLTALRSALMKYGAVLFGWL
jgi:hypothetical protein